MPDISIEQLSKKFGSEPALREVSFTVADGELLTLLGPSGCGKTTTLQSIAGFQRPDTGRITSGATTFFDSAHRIDLPAESRNLGIVFQSYAVWPHMTVADNVAFPLRVRKYDRREIARKVSETLELVEMEPYARRYPHELSGGQQQRVALARALVYSPSVLLLDEPFSNLDAKLRERARAWLKHLQTELALTTVFVTHDQSEALSMSDRILVMNRGEILQAGSPEEVYQQPTSRFVAEFLGQCNIVTGQRSGSNRAGLATIRVPDTDVELALAPDQEAVTDTVELAIRPEAIVISDAQQVSLPNSFLADIRGVSFLGDHYVYELQAGALELVATNPNRLTDPTIVVHIPPEACRPLNGHKAASDEPKLPEVARR